MDISGKIERLKSIRLLENHDDIVEFDNLIEVILNYEEKEHIRLLCSVFDDDTRNHEVMFGLIHAIEAYDGIIGPNESLEEVAKSIDGMKRHANDWLMILHKRILNHEPSCVAYTSIIRSSSDVTKHNVTELMQVIRSDNPSKFGESARRFIEAVN